jgi:hypothetical protein
MTNIKGISSRLLFAAIVFFLMPAPQAVAQIDRWGYWQNGVSEAWWFSTADFNADDADRAIARWNEIGAEPHDASEEWAGDFFSGGETHGTYLRWSPQGGFVIAHINKCEARAMEVTYGRVNVTKSLIEFIPEFHGGSRQHGEEVHHESEPLSIIRFVPVSWHGILHLVRPGEVSSFCDFAAGLGEHNAGFNPAGWLGLEYDFFYKLNSNGSETAGDLPIVPPGYEKFVKNPIEANIKSLLRRSVKRIPTVGGPSAYESHSMVWITAGSANGVKPKMIFRVRDSEGDDTIEIVRVTRASSLGRIVRSLDDDSNETYYDGDPKLNKQLAKRFPPIANGWRVTTAPK